MGHPRDFSEKRRSYRGRSPLAMNGLACQRAFLLTLVAFFAIYTFVTYLSTRSVLSHCAELAAFDASTQVTLPASDSATIAQETIADLSYQEPIDVQEKDREGSSEAVGKAEEMGEQITKSPAIAKVTMMYGPNTEDETMKLIMEGHKQHAARHGYGIHILDRQILHGLWSKHAWLLNIMLEEMQKPVDMRTKWLAWFNSDIIVMNPNVPLDIFLPPEDDFSHIDLLCTNDHNGLNNGAFMIRVGEWGVRYLVDSLALQTYKPDMKLKYSEQSAMEYTITEPKYANKTIFVPQRWFNAYRGPRNEKGVLFRGQKVPQNTIMPGDLQLHLVGKKASKGLMPLWVALAANQSSGWSVPLEQTKLPAEIALFWKLEKERREWDVPVANPKKSGRKGAKQTLDESPSDDANANVQLAVKSDNVDEKTSLNAPVTEGKSTLNDDDAADGAPVLSETEAYE